MGQPRPFFSFAHCWAFYIADCKKRLTTIEHFLIMLSGHVFASGESPEAKTCPVAINSAAGVLGRSDYLQDWIGLRTGSAVERPCLTSWLFERCWRRPSCSSLTTSKCLAATNTSTGCTSGWSRSSPSFRSRLCRTNKSKVTFLALVVKHGTQVRKVMSSNPTFCSFLWKSNRKMLQGKLMFDKFWVLYLVRQTQIA